MEYDMQKEARVWQRVQEGKQGPARQNEALPALAQEQMQLSNVYMQMSRQKPGQSGAAWMALARRARQQAACLRGIIVLTGGAAPQFRSAPLQTTAPEHLLRRCCTQELHLLREYESRRTDAEFGPVYDSMAQRTRETCCALLELIGNRQAGAEEKIKAVPGKPGF